MHSHLDFPSVEGKLNWKSEKYELTHANWEIAWTLLTTAENLRELHEFIAENAGQDIDDGKMFQHVLVRKGANAVESLYWLVKNHQYDAARGRARYLYETYLVLRALNRDQNRAAQKWDETKKEARQISQSPELKPLEKQTDALHTLRKDERKIIENDVAETDAYSDLWQLLSDRGSHPTSLRGSSVNSRHATSSEDSLLRMGLMFAFGIAAQYVRTFAGTQTRKQLHKRADHIFVEIKLALRPEGMPTMFEAELVFWDPNIRKSPFVEGDELTPE